MIFTLAVAMLAQAVPHPTPEETALMDRIEHEVRLPEGASPLARYHRSYAWLGDRTVIAIYEDFSDDPPARRWIEPGALPVINDGGCSVVTIFYHPTTRALDTMCNPDPFAQMSRRK